MAGDESVEELRSQIGEVDRTILEAVNARLLLVERLRALKESQGAGFLDTRQEHKVIGRLTRANRGPLSERGVRELMGEILELTKRELRKP